MLNKLGIGQLPEVRSVDRAPAVPLEVRVRGQVKGMGGGVTVLLDVVDGFVCTLSLDGKTRAGPLIAVPCAQDPLTPGLVAVDDDGKRALVMASRSAHGDAWLVLVDLAAHTRETVHVVDGPGWVVGGFFGKSIVALEQKLGETPRFTVFVNGKRVWSVEGMQQPCVPARLKEKDNVLALVVCPAPSPLTWTGKALLCVIDVGSGSLASLAPAEGSRVRMDGDVIVVEGGRETVRVAIG